MPALGMLPTRVTVCSLGSVPHSIIITYGVQAVRERGGGTRAPKMGKHKPLVYIRTLQGLKRQILVHSIDDLCACAWCACAPAAASAAEHTRRSPKAK